MRRHTTPKTEQQKPMKASQRLYIPEGRRTQVNVIKGGTDNETQVKIMRQSKKAGKQK